MSQAQRELVAGRASDDWPMRRRQVKNITTEMSRFFPRLIAAKLSHACLLPHFNRSSHFNSDFRMIGVSSRMTAAISRRTHRQCRILTYQSFGKFSSSSSSSVPNVLLSESIDNLLGKESTKFVSFLDEVDRKMNMSKNRNHSSSTLDSNSANDNVQKRMLGEMYSKTTASTTNYILEKGPISTISPPINTNRPPDFHSAKAYDQDLFQQYKDVLMEHIIANPKFNSKARNVLEYQTVCDWLVSDYAQVEYTLPLLDAEMAKETDGNNLDIFRQQLKDQHHTFLQCSRFTPDQVSLASASLAALSRYCAKRNQVVPLIVGWEKVKEAGLVLSEEEASTFLYVFGNSSALYSSMLLGSSRLGDLLLQNYGTLPSHRPSSVSEILTGTNFNASPMFGKDSTTISKEDKNTNIPAEVATYHDLLYKPTERSISIRVKALVAKGDAHGAQTLLESIPANDEARLRTYLPILKLHCEQGDVTAALSLFQTMRSIPTVHLESENYVLLIATLAEHGYFRPDSPPVKGMNSIITMKPNDEVLRGPKLLDFLLSQMAEDVLEITSASARRLHNSLLQGFQESSYGQNMTLVHSFTNMKHDNEPAKPNEFVVSRVAIDEKTAICPRTSVKLPLIVLNDEQRHQLRESVFKLSNEQHENFVRKKPNINFASDELRSFAKYLDSRHGKPFTVIVDGANVAYYMQNFDYGKFNWFQVQFMVKELIQLNENPLVIVPSKYCRPYFHNTTGTSTTKQVLQPKEKMVINSLLEAGRLYRVPANVYDDYHWILSSISEQRASRKGVDLDVQANDPQGRWPGTRPMIITNDQLKDLKIEMMEPRLFRRWFSSHIVNYTFTAFVDDECADDDICFSHADFFSREIQNDTTSDGTVWHIPVSDWSLNDRLCIRLQYKSFANKDTVSSYITKALQDDKRGIAALFRS